MRIDPDTRELVFEERSCYCDHGQVWDQTTWKDCSACGGTGKDPVNKRKNCRRCNPPGGSSFKRAGKMPDYDAKMPHDACNGTGIVMEKRTDQIDWVEVLHHITFRVNFGESLPALTEMIGYGAVGGTTIDYGDMFRLAQKVYQSTDDKDIGTRMAKQAVYQCWLEKRGNEKVYASSLCQDKSTKVADELVLVVTRNSYAVFAYMVDGERVTPV